MKTYNRIRLIVVLACIASCLLIACANDAHAEVAEGPQKAYQQVVEVTTVEVAPEIVEEQEQAAESEPEYVEFIATAYCSCPICCGEWAYNRPNGIVYGAAGRELVEEYSVAVDPSVIPYGTVFVDDTGREYRADDCGGAIKGNHIDIYFADHEKALEWGKQTIRISLDGV